MKPTNPTHRRCRRCLLRNLCHQTPQYNAVTPHSGLTMPRPSSSKRTKASRAVSAADRDDREARLLQAAAELDNGQHCSVRAAANTHHVPEATLRHAMPPPQWPKITQRRPYRPSDANTSSRDRPCQSYLALCLQRLPLDAGDDP